MRHVLKEEFLLSTCLNKINTLDLDGYTLKSAYKLIAKIKALKCCKAVLFKPSCHKGYHVVIICKDKNCDLCRFVFDDQERYAHDIERPKRTQNVLFTEYRYHGKFKRTIL